MQIKCNLDLFSLFSPMAEMILIKTEITEAQIGWIWKGQEVPQIIWGWMQQINCVCYLPETCQETLVCIKVL